MLALALAILGVWFLLAIIVSLLICQGIHLGE